jgi:hypothetical protein
LKADLNRIFEGTNKVKDTAEIRRLALSVQLGTPEADNMLADLVIGLCHIVDDLERRLESVEAAQAKELADWQAGAEAEAQAGDEARAELAELYDTCPACGGGGESGFVLVQATPVDPNRPLSPIEAAMLQEDISVCSFCKGNGRVADRQIAWRSHGQEWNAARKALGFGMREWAERVGVEPSVYFAMEHGRIEPCKRFSPIPDLIAKSIPTQQPASEERLAAEPY